MKGDDKNFRDVITEIIYSRDITMKELAHSINIAPSYFSFIVNGHRNVPVDFLNNIDSILCLSNAERETLISLINAINSRDDYSIKKMRKKMIKDIYELFVRLQTDNYDEDLIGRMMTTLNQIRLDNQKK
jgi:predicted transcriptional regulator